MGMHIPGFIKSILNLIYITGQFPLPVWMSHKVVGLWTRQSVVFFLTAYEYCIWGNFQ